MCKIWGSAARKAGNPGKAEWYFCLYVVRHWLQKLVSNMQTCKGSEGGNLRESRSKPQISPNHYNPSFPETQHCTQIPLKFPEFSLIQFPESPQIRPISLKFLGKQGLRRVLAISQVKEEKGMMQNAVKNLTSYLVALTDEFWICSVGPMWAGNSLNSWLDCGDFL